MSVPVRPGPNQTDIHAAVRRALANDGRVTRNEMLRLLAQVKRSGVTRGDREVLERAIGEALARTGGESSFTPGALNAFNAFRRSLGTGAEPFNQPLPSTEADAGNRLGQNPERPNQGYRYRIYGQHIGLRDGAGEVRGEVVSDEVQVNYGQKKQIDGRWYVYVFDVTMRTSEGELTQGSGWVPLSTFRDDAVLRMGVIDAVPAEDRQPVREYSLSTATSSYPEGATVVRNPVAGEGNQGPQDYLTRPGGVVNLLSALPGSGGVATDTFRVDQPGTTFIPSDVPTVERPVYLDGVEIQPPLTFVYGRVVTGDGESRYGWVAENNLSANAY